MLKNNSKDFLAGYENTKIIHYSKACELSNNVYYDELLNQSVVGVLKASRYVDGRLMQLYSKSENHVGVIAATRLGKTTSYVIPTILSFCAQKVKRSMIISDPKGELYRITAEPLRKAGYRIKLLNFRDHTHSEYWNPLTPIFRHYRQAIAIPDEVKVVNTEFGKRYSFRDRIYENEQELDETIKRVVHMSMDDVANEIDQIAAIIAPTQRMKDPYWEDSAREVLKGFFWAMLEDSDKKENPITEDTYSFNTIFEILSTIGGGTETKMNDNGYFSNRDKATSRAYKIVQHVLLSNADVTRACIMAEFSTKLAVFREITPRVITSCNSFDKSELVNGPVAVFIDYKDELKVHFQIISMFIQDAYRYLIAHANDKPMGKLDTPFYFILDEFGNFPKISDFETTISACAGRNIFFMLIIQSYAQLSNVYGEATAAIIRDNLNMHVFLGSNNLETLKMFSDECGRTTRVSPMSAINGSKATIENYQLETIPNMPISELSHLEPGDCIVTEANSGYVLYSRLERYYMCKEFSDLPQSDYREYKCAINPFDERYTYVLSSSKTKKKTNLFDDFNFDF